MVVEGLIYCLQTRQKLRRAEGSINAGGCNFNSFLRRTVRFVGTRHNKELHLLTCLSPVANVLLTCLSLQVCMCLACAQQLWSLTSSSCRQVTMLHSSLPYVNPTTLRPACRVTRTRTSLKTSAQDMTSTPLWLPGETVSVTSKHLSIHLTDSQFCFLSLQEDISLPACNSFGLCGCLCLCEYDSIVINRSQVSKSAH